MRETGDDWGTTGDFLDPSLAFEKFGLTDQPCRQDQPADELRNERILQHSDEDGLISRISSPPTKLLKKINGHFNGIQILDKS